MDYERSKQPLSLTVGDAKVLLGRRRPARLGDPYHFVLTLSWPSFFALTVVSFVLVNAAFGLAYWLDPGSVANARPDRFFDYLFFSIETLATVGYGVMAPHDAYGHVVASVEIFFGMLGIALITGLVFARFSRPRARIAFSERLLIRNETTAEGESFVRIHDLPLLRAGSPAFSLTWTLIHYIDAGSPLHGWTPEMLKEANGRIIVSVSGHDETMAATVYAIENYLAEDVAVGHRFVDVITTDKDGQRVIDLTRFNDIEPVG